MLRDGPVGAEGAARPPLWLEGLALVWLLWVYDLVSNLTPLRRGAALGHAQALWNLERTVHLAPEVTLDHWLAGHPGLGLWLSDYYDNAHFVVTLGVLGWLWWRHPGHYRPLRTSLVVINLLSFAVYWAYPMAPPRLVPGGGIVDVVAATHGFGSWTSGTLASVGDANQLGAMPSVHMAWALWSSWALWRVWGHRRRWVAAVFAYPVVTAVVVVATGNHFLVDVVAGVAVAVLATAAADHLYVVGSYLTGTVLHAGPSHGHRKTPIGTNAVPVAPADVHGGSRQTSSPVGTASPTDVQS